MDQDIGPHVLIMLTGTGIALKVPLTLFLLPPYVSDSRAAAGWSQGHGLQAQVKLWSDQKNDKGHNQAFL